jgi:hypothetical protein
MKILLSTITLLLLSSSFAIAQCSPNSTTRTQVTPSSSSTSFYGNTAFDAFLSNPNGSVYQNNTLQGYKKIQGSAFLYKEPVEGTLVLNDESLIEDVRLLVDLYANEVVVMKESGEMAVLDGRFYKEVRVPYEGKEIVLKKSDSNKPNKFYQVLYEDGDMIFFKDNYVTLQEGSNNGYSTTEPKFTKRTKYFIKYGDNQIAKVKLKKKDIFPLLPDSELYAMQEYARKKGLKLNSEHNFIAFFKGGKQ